MSTIRPFIVRDSERTQPHKLEDWINDLTEVSTRGITSQRLVVVGDLQSDHPRMPPSQGNQDALLVLLPLLIVLSTFLFLLLLFLVCVLLLRKRRGILLRDSDGPVDMGRQELIDGEGGFEGVEARWLESVDEETRRAYLKAKGEFDFWQGNYCLSEHCCHVLQTSRSRALPTPCPPISLFPSSWPYKRKESLPGLLNQIMRFYPHFLSTLAQSLLSSRILLPLLPFSLISPFRNSTKFITGK